MKPTLRRPYEFALVFVLACAWACRTQPWDFAAGAGAPPGLGGLDLAMEPPPDLAQADLTVLPDLSKIPWQQLPFVCRNLYIFDTSDMLANFDPITYQFTNIGQLGCTQSGSPQSMAVARDATAYVAYDSNEIFRVDTHTATCTPTTYPGALIGGGRYGMAFVADAPGSPTDSLFIITNETLFRLVLPSLSPIEIAPTDGGELSGTANAELWTFAPSLHNARIASVNQQTGALGTPIALPDLNGTPGGYAFASWGGDFWIFLRKQNEASSSVYQVNGATFAVTKVVSLTGREIVGVGVSSCAPTGLDN